MSTTTTAAIALASTDFSDGTTMPIATVFDGMGCTGRNQSPELHWSGVPAQTKSLALTLHDPDAPTTVGFTHWLLINLDPALTRLAGGAGAAGSNPPGSLLGINDMGQNAYGGPCPPPGDPPHRYQFTLYALDLPKLDTPPDAKLTYPLLRFMIRDHVLAQGLLTGRYAH